jgi:hypothetical protein
MPLGGYLPPFRAVFLLAALLVGAYGVNAGLAATLLLLFAYAAARYAAATTATFFRFTRRRVSDIKLLDDKKMRAFQRVTLRIFDLPHHPRRLRQVGLALHSRVSEYGRKDHTGCHHSVSSTIRPARVVTPGAAWTYLGVTSTGVLTAK